MLWSILRFLRTPPLAGTALNGGLRRLALGLVWVLGAQARPAEPVTLQLKWHHQFQFAGYYAAQAQGYYREAGLEVTLKEATPSLDPIREVAEGHAQYGVGSSTLLLARQQGRPVVVLAAIFQHSPLVLIARAGAGIHSPQDLVGRRVMLERQSDELLAFLSKEGVPVSSLKLLEHGLDPGGFIQSRADATSAYSTDEPFYFDRAGLRYLTFTPRTGGIDFYGDNLFTSEAELRDHPGRVRAFREASLRGWKYAMQHQEELADLILARYGRKHSRDYLLYEARQMVPLLQPDLVEMGYMHEERWRHIATTYAQLGQLEQPFSLQGFLYDPDAADRLLRQRLKLGLTVVLPIALLLGATALFLFGLSRRLTRALATQAELGAVIQENERRFRFITEHAGDVIWAMDLPTGRFTYVSPSVQQLRGFTPEEIMAQPAAEALTPESAARVRSSIVASMAEWKAGRTVTPVTLQLDQPHRDGRLIPTEVVTTLHPNAEGELVSVIGITRDITARRQAELLLRRELHSLEQLASTDPLTHAWNRRHFGEVVEGEMHRSDRHGHALTLLLLDIDHFKRINDDFGHSEGDRVLREVADCVRAAIRVSDSLTRWGGEEFIVLMPNTPLASAVTLAERIREGIEAHPFEGVGRVTASIGLAEYTPPDSRESWLERADQAMYRAKHKGRNRVECDPHQRATQLSAEQADSTFLKLVWSPVYQCGEPLLDLQHERLFHLANALLDALLSERPQEEVLPIVAGLLAEVVQHFQDEESLLQRLGYEGLALHASLHAQLVARGLELERAFLGGTLTLGHLFQYLAHDVVAQHMLKADREFFPLVEKARASQP